MVARADRWLVRADFAALLAVAGLHVAWGEGKSWPLTDRDALSRLVLGVEPGAEKGNGVPARTECYAVALALTTAAVLVGGRPRSLPRLRRTGVAGVTAVLGVRGVAGVTGQTSLLVPMATGEAFTSLDRRYYGPLCLVLAALSARSLVSGSAPSGP